MRQWLIRGFRRHPFTFITSVASLPLGLAALLILADNFFRGFVYRSLGNTRTLVLGFGLLTLTQLCDMPSKFIFITRADSSDETALRQTPDLITKTRRLVARLSHQRRSLLVAWTTLSLIDLSLTISTVFVDNSALQFSIVVLVPPVFITAFLSHFIAPLMLSTGTARQTTPTKD